MNARKPGILQLANGLWSVLAYGQRDVDRYRSVLHVCFKWKSCLFTLKLRVDALIGINFDFAKFHSISY